MILEHLVTTGVNAPVIVKIATVLLAQNSFKLTFLGSMLPMSFFSNSAGSKVFKTTFGISLPTPIDSG